MSERKRVGVLISGRGSNLQALIDAAAAPDYPAEIVLVLSNVPGTQGLARAEAAGIDTLVVNHKDFASREAFDSMLDATLKQAGIELLCNAGFMRLHTEAFVRSWWNRHLNIHPSLLPAFKGLHTHARVLAEGAKISGCTVHFVRTEMDTGPIVAQAALPVLANDTPDSLAARVLKAEHRLYQHALKLVASGAAHVEGDHVVVKSVAGKPATDKPVFGQPVVGMTQISIQPPIFSPPFDEAL